MQIATWGKDLKAQTQHQDIPQLELLERRINYEAGAKKLSNKDKADLIKFAGLAIQMITVDQDGIYLDLKSNAILCTCNLKRFKVSGINFGENSLFLLR